MASLISDTSKRNRKANKLPIRRIEILLPDGTRPAIRLGRIPINDAREILSHIRHLDAAKVGGTALPQKTVAWLNDAGDALRDRLAVIGLAPPRVVVRQHTVADIVAMFKAKPKWQQLAPSTVKNYSRHFAGIEAGLGAATPIENVTEADADNLRGFLLAKKPKGQGWSVALASRAMGSASMLFRAAVRARLRPLNPFEGVEQGSMVSDQTAFVDAETSRSVFEALQGTEWRLLFALARTAGLRVPSEPRVIRWGDVDVERKRFRVNSPKTGSRMVPMFGELEQLFRARYDEAETGEEFVLPMMQGKSDATFSSHLAVVIRRLKLEPWSRLFHSMRSTCQTELEEHFPSHCVASWLGNSVDTAHLHYLQTVETHFEKAAHFAPQHISATPRQASPIEGGQNKNTLGVRDAARVG